MKIIIEQEDSGYTITANDDLMSPRTVVLISKQEVKDFVDRCLNGLVSFAVEDLITSRYLALTEPKP